MKIYIFILTTFLSVSFVGASSSGSAADPSKGKGIKTLPFTLTINDYSGMDLETVKVGFTIHCSSSKIDFSGSSILSSAPKAKEDQTEIGEFDIEGKATVTFAPRAVACNAGFPWKVEYGGKFWIENKEEDLRWYETLYTKQEIGNLMRSGHQAINIYSLPEIKPTVTLRPGLADTKLSDYLVNFNYLQYRMDLSFVDEVKTNKISASESNNRSFSASTDTKDVVEVNEMSVEPIGDDYMVVRGNMGPNPKVSLKVGVFASGGHEGFYHQVVEKGINDDYPESLTNIEVLLKDTKLKSKWDD